MRCSWCRKSGSTAPGHLASEFSASYWGGECFSSGDTGQTAMFRSPQRRLRTRLSLAMRSLASAQAGLWGHSRSGSPIVR